MGHDIFRLKPITLMPSCPPLVHNVVDPVNDVLFLARFHEVRATFLVEACNDLLELFDRISPDTVSERLRGKCQMKPQQRIIAGMRTSKSDHTFALAMVGG